MTLTRGRGTQGHSQMTICSQQVAVRCASRGCGARVTTQVILREKAIRVPFVCIVATLAGAKNYREIPQGQLRLLGAGFYHFRNCYRHPRRTLIWTVLTNVDAAAPDRITGAWLLAQARKYRDEGGEIKWVIAIDGKVMRGAWTDENDQVTCPFTGFRELALADCGEWR